MYRDVVGNGQLQFVENYELPQFKTAFERVAPSYNPGFTFIIQKRTTEEQWNVGEEFYIVSQDIRESTTTPSRFAVLNNENNFDVSTLQRLTHNLCFWDGGSSPTSAPNTSAMHGRSQHRSLNRAKPRA